MIPEVWVNHDLYLELLRRGADVGAKNHYGLMALHRAARSGYAKVCSALLRHGAKVDERSADGMTALHFAASCGQAEVCDLLVDEGADVNGKCLAGYTALTIAASHGDAALCVGLCDRGADVNAMDDRGRVALSWAVHSRMLDTCFALIACGSNVSGIHGSNKTFRTALSFSKLLAAVKYGNHDLLGRILETDIDSHTIVLRVTKAISRTQVRRPETASLMRSWLARRAANEALRP